MTENIQPVKIHGAVGVVRHRCSSLFCPQCSTSRGRPHLYKGERMAASMVQPMMITITVDQRRHDSPQGAYEYVSHDRVIGSLLRRIATKDYFYTLQLQRNGWPHWHVICEGEGLGITTAGLNRALSRHGLEAQAKPVTDVKGAVGYICRDFLYAAKAKWQPWILQLDNVRLVEFSRSKRPAAVSAQAVQAPAVSSAKLKISDSRKMPVVDSASVYRAVARMEVKQESCNLFCDWDSLPVHNDKPGMKEQAAIAKIKEVIGEAHHDYSYLTDHRTRSKLEKMAWCGLEIALVDETRVGRPMLSRVPCLPEWLDECDDIMETERMGKGGRIYKSLGFASKDAAYAFAEMCHQRYAEVKAEASSRLANFLQKK